MDLKYLVEKTHEILDILNCKEYTPEEQIEELVLLGFDYEDIIDLALSIADAKK